MAEPSFGNTQRGGSFPATTTCAGVGDGRENSSWITLELKNEAQNLGKNIWLFQLQLLRGHRVAAPPVLHCFSWLSGRNTGAGCKWFLLSVHSLPFLFLCIYLSFPPSPAPPSFISWLYLLYTEIIFHSAALKRQDICNARLRWGWKSKWSWRPSVQQPENFYHRSHC